MLMIFRIDIFFFYLEKKCIQLCCLKQVYNKKENFLKQSVIFIFLHIREPFQKLVQDFCLWSVISVIYQIDFLCYLFSFIYFVVFIHIQINTKVASLL